MERRHKNAKVEMDRRRLQACANRHEMAIRLCNAVKSLMVGNLSAVEMAKVDNEVNFCLLALRTVYKNDKFMTLNLNIMENYIDQLRSAKLDADQKKGVDLKLCDGLADLLTTIRLEYSKMSDNYLNKVVDQKNVSETCDVLQNKEDLEAINAHYGEAIGGFTEYLKNVHGVEWKPDFDCEEFF